MRGCFQWRLLHCVVILLGGLAEIPNNSAVSSYLGMSMI